MFDQISVEDPRVSELCNKTSEPSPYQILLTCLQKNHGMGDTNIDTEMVPMKKHQKSKYIMRLGAYYLDFTNFFVQLANRTFSLKSCKTNSKTHALKKL